LGLLLALGGCASIPQVSPALGAPSVAQKPQILGVHGPLSNRQISALLARLTVDPSEDALLKRHLAVEQAVAESPLYAGSQTRLLEDGPDAFRAMFAAIRSAKHSINLEYFILEDVESDGERLGDLLIAKRKQGVAVNIIYDSLGSFMTPGAFFDRLKAGGITLVEFNPLNPLKAKAKYSINDRDHRKILVVDGATGMTGGINLDVSYEIRPDGSSMDITGKTIPRLHDIAVELKGPVVAQLQRLFFEHWREQHGPPMEEPDPFPALPAKGGEVVRIIGSTPDHTTPRYYVTLISAIRSAQKSIIVCAAFFVPTHDETAALKAAARRGVDVRLLVPGQGESGLSIAVGQSHYGELMRAGVKIYETHDIILHAKTVTVDGVWSVIGSSNFDPRSVIFNDEVDAVVLGADTAKALEAMFERNQSVATRVDHEAWKHRPLRARLHEVYARIWEKLL
jgi:cardiolipin synthase